MKISLKKKHIVTITSFISIALLFIFVQEVWIQISQKSLSALITPLIFLVSSAYSINYFSTLRVKEKLINEVSSDASNGNPVLANKIKNHLWKKSYEEAYTINIILGRIIFTSSWRKQDEIEKLKSENIPDVIKQELIQRLQDD